MPDSWVHYSALSKENVLNERRARCRWERNYQDGARSFRSKSFVRVWGSALLEGEMKAASRGWHDERSHTLPQRETQQTASARGASTPPFGGFPFEEGTHWPSTAKAIDAAARGAVLAAHNAAERALAEENALKRYTITPAPWEAGRWLRPLPTANVHSMQSPSRLAISAKFRRSHSVPPGYKPVALDAPFR